MQIVIDIPKEKYELCKKWKPSERHELQKAVANGIPLPKGHGDLKDVGWLLNKMNNADANTLPRTPNEYYAWSFAQALLTQAPTIIPATKGEENGN